MAIRIPRMSALFVLMGFLAAVLPCGCAPKSFPSAKALPPKVTAPVYPTIEEAAMAAWDFREPGMEDSVPVPGKGAVDRAATIRLWRSKPELFEDEKGRSQRRRG